MKIKVRGTDIVLEVVVLAHGPSTKPVDLTAFADPFLIRDALTQAGNEARRLAAKKDAENELRTGNS